MQSLRFVRNGIRFSDFGFIIVDETEERIFVHANSVLTFLPTIVCVLHEGDKVSCESVKLKALPAEPLLFLGRVRHHQWHEGDGGPGCDWVGEIGLLVICKLDYSF